MDGVTIGGQGVALMWSIVSGSMSFDRNFFCESFFTWSPSSLELSALFHYFNSYISLYGKSNARNVPPFRRNVSSGAKMFATALCSPEKQEEWKKTLKLSHRVTYERCFAELRKCECAGNLLFAKVFLFAQMWVTFFGRERFAVMGRGPINSKKLLKELSKAFTNVAKSWKASNVTQPKITPISIYTSCHWNVPCLVNELCRTPRKKRKQKPPDMCPWHSASFFNHYFRYPTKKLLKITHEWRVNAMLSTKPVKSLCPKRAQQMHAINFSAGFPTRKQQIKRFNLQDVFSRCFGLFPAVETSSREIGARRKTRNRF